MKLYKKILTEFKFTTKIAWSDHETSEQESSFVSDRVHFRELKCVVGRYSIRKNEILLVVFSCLPRKWDFLLRLFSISDHTSPANLTKICSGHRVVPSMKLFS